MSHSINLESIKSLLTESYVQETTTVVPKKGDLTFGNTIKRIDHAVIFYVDMRGSRKIIQTATNFWSIKTHRAFLQAVIYCVENRDGHFRSFNGDGALAFFVGSNAASRAVRAALDLKAYVVEMNKILKAKIDMEIDFGVGIGQGPLSVAKSGKRGDDSTKQDLVWVGLSVYVAVELSDFARSPNNIWISPNVRNAIGKENHLNVVNNKDGESIWSKVSKKMKSVGDYEVRYTSYQSTLF